MSGIHIPLSKQRELTEKELQKFVSQFRQGVAKGETVEFHLDCNIGDLMDIAMQIRTQEEANEFMNALVRFSLRHHALGNAGQPTREEAIEIGRINIGYWMGYYSTHTKIIDNMKRFFLTEHPYFCL